MIKNTGKKIKSQKVSSLSLYSIHLPLLALAALAIFSGVGSHVLNNVTGKLSLSTESVGVVAGDSVKEGVYTNTITKDGKTFVTTKTILGTKVTIEQKIYDSDGNLINTKVTEKYLEQPATKSVDEAPVSKETTTQPKTTQPQTAPLKPVVDPEAIKPVPEPLSLQERQRLQLEVGEEGIDLDTSYPALRRQMSAEEIATKARTLRNFSMMNILRTGDVDSDSYVVSGNVEKRFLGLFKTRIPVKYTYDAETDTFEKEGQPLFYKVVDILSVN